MRSENVSDGTCESRTGRRGFTLVELLVVILIILLVSAVALPTLISAISHRQVSEAARLVQGAFVGARDAAIHANAPRGIRLLPDPAFPIHYATINGVTQIDPTHILAADRIVPIQPAPDYSEGTVSILHDTVYPFPGGVPVYPRQATLPYPYPNANLAFGGAATVSVLMVEQSPYTFSGGVPIPNPPTSWFWNVRVGDKIRFNNSGRFYTVVGPLTVYPGNPVAALNGNPELFVNDGYPSATAPPPLLQRTYLFTAPGGATTTLPANVEYLFLVNGLDDNNDGLVDSGWDGIDNNLDGLTDEIVPTVNTVGSEWEFETWDDALARPPALMAGLVIQNLNGTGIPSGYLNASYTIVRRPLPSPNQKEVALPSNVVIDLTTWATTQERSRMLPAINQFTGYVDILVSPEGDLVPTSPYATPASFGMANSFFHFWLAERGDLFDPDTTAVYPPYLPLPTGLLPAATAAGRALKGESRLVTLFTRSGQLTTNEIFNFDAANAGTALYNPSLPFLQAQQGARGGH